MVTSFAVVLDACVLVPIALCDTLLSLADRGLYRPLWSDMILDETERNIARLLVKHGKSAEEAATKARRRRAYMEEAFPEASVQGSQGLIAAMTNHEKDRHVLAAAERGNAQIIVTENTRDFPLSSLEPYNIERKTADDFLIDVLGFDAAGVIAAIKDMTAQKTTPPLTELQILKRIAKNAPNFAAAVLIHLES